MLLAPISMTDTGRQKDSFAIRMEAEDMAEAILNYGEGLGNSETEPLLPV